MQPVIQQNSLSSSRIHKDQDHHQSHTKMFKVQLKLNDYLISFCLGAGCGCKTTSHSCYGVCSGGYAGRGSSMGYNNSGSAQGKDNSASRHSGSRLLENLLASILCQQLLILLIG